MKKLLLILLLSLGSVQANLDVAKVMVVTGCIFTSGKILLATYIEWKKEKSPLTLRLKMKYFFDFGFAVTPLGLSLFVYNTPGQN
jgi:hypothetical protein